MNINVTATKVTIDKGSIVNKGEYNIRDCNFTLSEEYNGLVCKALFTIEKTKQTYEQSIVNNKCTIPYEVTVEKGAITLGVIGYEIEDDELIKRYSPLPYHFTIEDGSYVEDIENQSTPTPSELEQLEQRVSTIEIDAEQVEINTQNISDLQENKADKSELEDFITKDVNDLTYYTLTTQTGSQIELSLNSTNFKMTATLKDKNGTVVNTSNEIDLPLESVVVNASYDSSTKELVLTLQNGTTVRASIADLVSGLQTEITSSNKLASDLVDDSTSTNKFVTASEKTQITTNKNNITSLNTNKEDKSNKVTSLNSSSTNTQYPSAKAVYDNIDALKGKTVTGTGSNITLSNTAELEFIQPPLPRGNSEQDGEPSPTNEVPITNVTGDVEVLVQNKNIALNDNPENPDANYTSSGSGTQPVQYSSTEGAYYTTGIRNRIFSNITQQVTVSVYAKLRSESTSTQANPIRLFNYNTETDTTSSSAVSLVKLSDVTTSWQRFSRTVTLSEGYNAIKTSIYSNVFFKDFQVEYNSVETTYTPHQEQTLPLTLGDIELCKIRDYQDYFYKDNGKWYLYKAINKVEITDENVNSLVGGLNTTTYSKPYITITKSLLGWKSSWTQNISLINNYSVITSTSKIESGTYAVNFLQSYLTIFDDRFTDLATARQLMIGTIIYITLATSTSTEITDTTLIEQLDAISNATSYEEQTNISGTSDESNPLFEVQAVEYKEPDYWTIAYVKTMIDKALQELS